MTKKTAHYSGDLDQPIVAYGRNHLLKKWALAGNKAAIAAQLAHIQNEYKRKVRLLAECYGIRIDKPDGWLELALALADEHVRGFQVITGKEPRPGRKKRWTRTEKLFLIRQVDNYCRRNNVKAYRACTELVKQGQPYPDMSRDSLRRRYSEAKKEN